MNKRKRRGPVVVFGLGALMLASLLLVALSCDGEMAEPSPTRAAFPPELISVEPGDGATLGNVDLLTDPSGLLGGICATFAFQAGEGMGDEPTSAVRMTFDNVNVTGSLVWVATDDFPPSRGTGCFTPPELLDEGLHRVTLEFSNVEGRAFTYSWSFEVSDPVTSLDPVLPSTAGLVGEGIVRFKLAGGQEYEIDSVAATQQLGVQVPACAAMVFAMAWKADGPGAADLRVLATRQGVSTEIGSGPEGGSNSGCALLQFVSDLSAIVVVEFKVGTLG